jgi:hypothetical protein
MNRTGLAGGGGCGGEQLAYFHAECQNILPAAKTARQIISNMLNIRTPDW